MICHNIKLRCIFEKQNQFCRRWRPLHSCREAVHWKWFDAISQHLFTTQHRKSSKTHLKWKSRCSLGERAWIYWGKLIDRSPFFVDRSLIICLLGNELRYQHNKKDVWHSFQDFDARSRTITRNRPVFENELEFNDKCWQSDSFNINKTLSSHTRTAQNTFPKQLEKI